MIPREISDREIQDCILMLYIAEKYLLIIQQ